MKTPRNAASRPLAYRDGAGRPFRLVQTDEMQRILHHIDREASGRIEVPELVTTPGAKRRFLVSSLQEEAITTAILEGANRDAAPSAGRSPVARRGPRRPAGPRSATTRAPRPTAGRRGHRRRAATRRGPLASCAVDARR